MLDFKEYIKRPIPVKVCQLTEELWQSLYENCADCEFKINGYTIQADTDDKEEKIFYINTLEDVSKDKLHKAKINDYLIVGVEGEIYACDKDIFEKTYRVNSELPETAIICDIFLSSGAFNNISILVEENGTEKWIFEDINGNLWKYETYSSNPFDIDIGSVKQISSEYLKQFGNTYNDYIKSKESEKKND